MIFNGLLLKFKLAQLKSVTSRHHLPQNNGLAPLPCDVSEGAASHQSHCGDNPTAQSMLLPHLQSRALGGDQKREVTDTRAKKDSPSTCGWALP